MNKLIRINYTKILISYITQYIAESAGMINLKTNLCELKYKIINTEYIIISEFIIRNYNFKFTFSLISFFF